MWYFNILVPIHGKTGKGRKNMIEKLEMIKAFNCSDTPQAKMQHHNYHNDCIKKINELVDTINELQTKVNKLEAKVNFAKPEVKETFVCPEQYKWIGKLCKFWDYADKPVFGFLDNVDVDNKEYPYTKLGGSIFQNCEPVKPDDSIIYKGD